MLNKVRSWFDSLFSPSFHIEKLKHQIGLDFHLKKHPVNLDVIIEISKELKIIEMSNEIIKVFF